MLVTSAVSSFIFLDTDLMKTGIIGPALSGKTTAFNALTGLGVGLSTEGSRPKNNLGSIKINDERLDKLALQHQSKRKVPAEIVVYEPNINPYETGFIKKMLQACQSCMALIIVVNDQNPAAEIEDIFSEILLYDQMPIETRINRLAKEGKTSTTEYLLMERCLSLIEDSQPLSQLELSEPEQNLLSGFAPLSLKPIICLINSQQDNPEQISLSNPYLSQTFSFNAKLEEEISLLSASEQVEFRASMNLENQARDRFIGKVFDALDLICFFTTGADETRAWPVKRASSAWEAAAKIHSDIQRGFIAAETINCQELLTLGGEQNARKQGKLKSEGKTYVVQDGDVITFRFNV